MDCLYKSETAEKFVEIVKSTYKLRKSGSVFVGILYTAISTTGFNCIDDINAFVNIMSPDLLLLKSMVDGNEIEIYRSGIEDFRIDKHEKKIIVKFLNRPEVEILF